MDAEKRGRTPDRREGPPLYVRPRDGNAVGGSIRVDTRSVTFFAVLVALIGLGGWLYMQQASEVASLAHQIRVMQRDKERLHREITALRGEVAMLGSLGRVLEAGTELGYRMPVGDVAAASDGQRRLRVVYQPLPLPGGEVGGPVVAHGAPGSGGGSTEDATLGVVERLVEQLRAWIEAPVDDDRAEPALQSAPRP